LTDTYEYHHLFAELHDTLILSCASNSSKVIWTVNSTTDFYSGHGIIGFSPIYSNGSIVDYDINFRKVYKVVNSTNLEIYNIYQRYSGVYECSDPNGGRIAVYVVVVAGL